MISQRRSPWPLQQGVASDSAESPSLIPVWNACFIVLLWAICLQRQRGFYLILARWSKQCITVPKHCWKTSVILTEILWLPCDLKISSENHIFFTKLMHILGENFDDFSFCVTSLTDLNIILCSLVQWNSDDSSHRLVCRLIGVTSLPSRDINRISRPFSELSVTHGI
jgi:hypothetical protein